MFLKISKIEQGDQEGAARSPPPQKPLGVSLAQRRVKSRDPADFLLHPTSRRPHPSPQCGQAKQGEQALMENSSELSPEGHPLGRGQDWGPPTEEGAGLGTESRGGRGGSKVGSGEGSCRSTGEGAYEDRPFSGRGLEGALRGSSGRGLG